MSGTSSFMGTATIRLNIFNMTKSIQVYVYDDKIKNHDILLGLDTIHLFRLKQDENLCISQAPLTNKKSFSLRTQPENKNFESENLIN